MCVVLVASPQVTYVNFDMEYADGSEPDSALDATDKLRILTGKFPVGIEPLRELYDTSRYLRDINIRSEKNEKVITPIGARIKSEGPQNPKAGQTRDRTIAASSS